MVHATENRCGIGSHRLPGLDYVAFRSLLWFAHNQIQPYIIVGPLVHISLSSPGPRRTPVVTSTILSTELHQWVSTVLERCSFRNLAFEQGLIHTAVWAAKLARGLGRVLMPDSSHTFHEFRRSYCIAGESWLLFEWWAPYCMKKSSPSKKCIIKVAFVLPEWVGLAPGALICFW